MEEPLPHKGQQQQRHAAKRPVEGPAGGAKKQEGSNASGSPPTHRHPQPPQPQQQQQQQHLQEEEEEGEEEQQKSKRARSTAAASSLLTTTSTSTSTLIVIEDSNEEEADKEQVGEKAGPQSATATSVAPSIPMLRHPPLLSRRHHPRLHALLASLSSSSSSSSSSVTFFELPSLIIVDLDFTLWKGNVSDQLPPFTQSTHPDHVHVRGVFSSSGWGGGRGGGGGGGKGGGAQTFRLFPEAREVLTALHSTSSTTLAIASRAPNTQAAVHMLQLMKLHAFFLSSPSFSTSSSSPSSSVAVEKGEEEGGTEGKNKERSKKMLMHISNEGFGKTKHLREILRTAKAKAHQVLFFDDQRGNLQDARKLGCCAQAVTSTEGLSWAALESGLRSYREQSRARQMMARMFVKK